MAEEHQEAATPGQTGPVAGSWNDPNEISDARQAELAEMQRTWDGETEHGKRRGPFDGVRLSGADAFWLAACALAGAEGNIADAAARLRSARDKGLVRLTLDLSALHLEGAFLRAAHLEGAALYAAHLEGADLWQAHLEGADLGGAHLEGAVLGGAHLERADLGGAHLEGAGLYAAHLEGADLYAAHLEGADLRGAHLEGADLGGAHLDGKTDLAGAVLAKRLSLLDRLLRRNTSVALGDIRWGGVGTVDLTAAQWDNVWRLGDERGVGFRASADKHEQVVRAYRQLAAQLRAQGISEVADRFAHRAQIRQRGVLLRRFRLGQWLFSWFLTLLAGYGFRPGRTIFWYLVMVFGFAALYLHFGHISGHPFDPDEALVFSVTSFHGRGFFPGSLDLKDVVVKLAALEAVVGLLIEISFIATFTQRFFGAR